MSVQSLTIPATDGFALAANLFPATGNTPKKTVLIAPATGVALRLYRSYGEFLAGQGLAVITWDWRGTGQSRPASLRGFKATMRDWGEKDLAGIIHWAHETLGTDLVAVGHSFGGQGLGLAHNSTLLTRLATVASQNGYWGLWPFPVRYKYAFFSYLLLPALTRLLGYFPGQVFGQGEDLPAGVALQWAKWCRRPEYLATYDGHRAMQAPLLALGFADDPYAPRKAIERLHAQYGSAKKEIRFLAPQDLGAPKVGHFGFFRKDRVPGLWQETADWLLA